MFKNIIFYYICLNCFVISNFGKVFKRCDLVRELKNRHNVPYEEIGEWICIMFWESGFDTKAHRIGNFDGSSNYGIFQINDLLWCQSIGRKNNTNFCDSSCEKFRDSSINDDIKCALLIYKLQGFDAWGTYNTKCRSDTSSYVEGCGVKQNQFKIMTENKTDDKDLTKSPEILIPSVKDLKQSSLIQQLFQMSKTSLSLPEKLFKDVTKRSIHRKPNNREVSTILNRSKRGLLGQDSINPFEDARIFVFNPLCCFNWKAAEVEWSNAKNWMRDIRTSIG